MILQKMVILILIKQEFLYKLHKMFMNLLSTADEIRMKIFCNFFSA